MIHTSNIHCTSLLKEKQSLYIAHVDLVRKFEPYDWWGTFTFKTDIVSYAGDNPKLWQSVGYEWVDQTEKYQNGTYVRKYELVRLKPGDNEWDRTSSYVKELQENHSERQYRRWIRNLNERIYGRRYKEKKLGVSHVYAIEFQKRGVAHVHALIKGVPNSISRIEFEQIWEKQHPNNGFANIFPYDPEKGARGYIGKYITKGGIIKLDIRPQHSMVVPP